jgi:hypothetical protein
MLSNALGIPSTQDFKAIIRINRIVNNASSTKNINIAKKIFGAKTDH